MIFQEEQSCENTVRYVLKLEDSTKEKFALWKSLGDKLHQVAADNGTEVTDVVYDDDKQTKTATTCYGDLDQHTNAILKVGQYAVTQGLISKIISRRVVECTSSKLIKTHKEKYSKKGLKD